MPAVRITGFTRDPSELTGRPKEVENRALGAFEQSLIGSASAHTSADDCQSE
jgi:hypothetical protein